MYSPEKQKQIDNVLLMLKKQYGAESINVFTKMPRQQIDVLDSGSLKLNIALGLGGYPRGRIIEIYGHESSGKTTMTLHAISSAQKKNLVCAFIDVEHAFNPVYAKALGIDMDKLLFSQPNTGEEATGIALTLAESGAVDVIVIDSIAALVPKAELEGTMEDQQMGLQARMMSKFCRMAVGVVEKNNVTLFLINQVRMKIGVMYGNPESTSGGMAVRFAASIRMEVKKKQKIDEGGVVAGNEHVVNIVKNKVAPPYRTAEFRMIFGKGIDRIGEIIDLGVQYSIIEKAGAFYSYNGERLGQGLANTIKLLESKPELVTELSEKIMDYKEDIEQESESGSLNVEKNNESLLEAKHDALSVGASMPDNDLGKLLTDAIDKKIVEKNEKGHIIINGKPYAQFDTALKAAAKNSKFIKDLRVKLGLE